MHAQCIVKELHLKQRGKKTRRQEDNTKKMKRHFELKSLLQNITNHKEHEVNRGHAFCTLHLKLCWQNLSAKCKTLNPKPYELHLHPTLTLNPKP